MIHYRQIRPSYSKSLIFTYLIAFFLCFTSCINLNTSATLTPQSNQQGTLNLANVPPITLDPAEVGEVTSASYVVQIFSGLVQFDENLQIVPDIAQTWDQSADGKTFTFHLRHHAKFQDGKPVTASDFKYSWERALAPATQSTAAGTYLVDIVGATEVLSGKATQLSGVQAVDSYTLKVTIDAPKAYFLEKMGFPTTFVVDRTNVQTGSNWWLQPNGSGPFKLSQFTQSQLVLQRNDNYYGNKAKLNQVVFQLYSGNPMQSYQEGSIDAAAVGPSYMGIVTDPSNSISKELKLFPELSIAYLGFNTTKPPFDDPKVRQAFTYAVDMDKVMSLSVNSVYPTAHTIVPPNIPGYNNSSIQGINYDPAKAKQLISQSKYGDVTKLPPIVITTQGWGGQISGILGGIIEEWRRNLGVEVTVRQLEPEVFPYVIVQDKTEVDQIFDTGWIADYPDPQDFLAVLFHSGVDYNTGSYSNTQFDALLDQAAIEKDANNRMKLYQQAEQIIVSDAAVLPEYFGRTYMVIKPYVKDYFINALGYPLLSKVSIQK